jgi:hypothetical protein
MRFAYGLTLFVCLQLPSAALAQAPASSNQQNYCSPGQSCQMLKCSGPCTEKWVNGQCVGGLCPQGVAPMKQSPGTPTNEPTGTDLRVYNVTPDL